MSWYYKAGIKFVAKSNPTNSMLNISGVKNPQTGHKLLSNVKTVMIPLIVMN